MRSECDLNDLIGGVLELVAPEARLAGVKFDLRLDQGLPTVVLDSVQVQQVVVNLIRNAMDAIQESDSEIRTISIATSQVKPSSIEVSIRDSGSGLGDLHADDLFEPFYSTKSSGLGMGLAICRSIVDSHDGRLWAERGCQQGAEFRFELPVEIPGDRIDV